MDMPYLAIVFRELSIFRAVFIYLFVMSSLRLDTGPDRRKEILSEHNGIVEILPDSLLFT